MVKFTQVIYARVAKWQTHYLEVVAPARAWRFKSSPAHIVYGICYFVV
jgi:5-deoxy-D-glucuronate isomerase